MVHPVIWGHQPYGCDLQIDIKQVRVTKLLPSRLPTTVLCVLLLTMWTKLEPLNFNPWMPTESKPRHKKISNSQTPIRFGWAIGGMVHRKSSTRRVTHLSTIMAFSGLTSEFPWDPGQGLGFKSPCKHVCIGPKTTPGWSWKATKC